MSGWGSWATGLAKHATSTVTQFGTDVLDSVTAVDDNDDDEVARAQARALFEYESEAAERERAEKDKPSPAKAPAAAAAVGSDAGAAPASGWLPPELGFAAGRGKTLLSLGRTAVESGASAAGKAMDDEATRVAPPPAKRQTDDGSTTNALARPTLAADGAGDEDGWDDFEDMDDDDGEGKSSAAAANVDDDDDDSTPSQRLAAAVARPGAAAASTAPATTTTAAVAATPHLDDKPASEILAEIRGELTLAVHEAGDAAVERLAAAQAVAEEVVDPASIGEFSIDGAEEEEAAVDWVAQTPVGARIRTARRDIVALLSETTGEPLAGDELIDALPTLPERAAEVAGSIVDIVQQELASVLSVVRGAVECDEAGAGWWPGALAADGDDNMELAAARLFADAVRAVVFYALCEAAAGTRALCDVALRAATHAKQSHREDAKQVKQRSLDVRGDCHIDAAAQFVALEDAAESALVIVAAIAALLHAAPSPAAPPPPPAIRVAAESDLDKCVADTTPELAPAEVDMPPQVADNTAEEETAAVSANPPQVGESDSAAAAAGAEPEGEPATPVSPPRKTAAGGKGKGGKRKGLGGATKKAD